MYCRKCNLEIYPDEPVYSFCKNCYMEMLEKIIPLQDLEEIERILYAINEEVQSPVIKRKLKRIHELVLKDYHKELKEEKCLPI